MENLKKLKPGRKIEILCHNSNENKCEWLPGTFNGIVSALDRDYRINCTLSTGVEIREAAPECVRLAADKICVVCAAGNIVEKEPGEYGCTYCLTDYNQHGEVTRAGY